MDKHLCFGLTSDSVGANQQTAAGASKLLRRQSQAEPGASVPPESGGKCQELWGLQFVF